MAPIAPPIAVAANLSRLDRSDLTPTSLAGTDTYASIITATTIPRDSPNHPRPHRPATTVANPRASPTPNPQVKIVRKCVRALANAFAHLSLIHISEPTRPY